MRDSRLEEDIKNTKKFLEFWSKFHEIYKNILSDRQTLKLNEEGFFSTRILVNSRFQDLMDTLGIKHGERLTKALPIYQILSLDKLSEMSDDKFNQIEGYWTDSYVFLSSLLKKFQKKRRRIKRFNKTIFVVKNAIRNIKKRGAR